MKPAKPLTENVARYTSIFSIFTACLFTISCSRYQVTLNDNVVYTPGGKVAPPALVSDPNLQGCLNRQLINADNDPAKITLLACPSANISNLAGIGNLPNLEQLELSDNRITDLSPMVALKKLRVLSLRNNRITTITTLYSLPILRFVALEGNLDIRCRQLDTLEEKLGNTLGRPERCAD